MKVSTFSVVILLLMSSVPVVPKGQFVQPLNMGMQVAIPYDIANIFNRPINFGPISALISTGSLLYILFFGVITSPFGYFFGIPSEKYVLGDTWPIKQDGKERIWDENNNHYNQPRNLRQDVTTVLRKFVCVTEIYVTKIVRIFIYSAPRDFEEHVFSGRLGEDLRDDECRKMVICSAHNGLRNLPEWFMKGYKFFR